MVINPQHLKSGTTHPPELRVPRVAPLPPLLQAAHVLVHHVEVRPRGLSVRLLGVIGENQSVVVVSQSSIHCLSTPAPSHLVRAHRGLVELARDEPAPMPAPVHVLHAPSPTGRCRRHRHLGRQRRAAVAERGPECDELLAARRGPPEGEVVHVHERVPEPVPEARHLQVVREA